MSDSRLADILDALYDGLVAEATIAAQKAAGNLLVTDGPVITDFAGKSMLTVGGRPIQDDDSETTSEWDWGSLGVSGTNADIDELIRIPCGIASLSGDADMRTCRRTAITIYVAAAAYIRGTTLSIPQVMWAIPQPTALRQQQGRDGAECFIDFTAVIRTRI